MSNNRLYLCICPTPNNQVDKKISAPSADKALLMFCESALMPELGQQQVIVVDLEDIAVGYFNVTPPDGNWLFKNL